jgi:hypothetical protein
MNSKHISLKGRVFGRDFIYRKRVSKSRYSITQLKLLSRYSITQLKLFTRIDIGKRCLYISKSPTAFWNMQGVVSNEERDYVIHSA